MPADSRAWRRCIDGLKRSSGAGARRRSAATICRRRRSAPRASTAQPLAGRQMVDVLNAVGLELGDVRQSRVRCAEGRVPRSGWPKPKFKIVSSNVTDANGKPFDATRRSRPSFRSAPAAGRSASASSASRSTRTGSRGCSTAADRRAKAEVAALARQGRRDRRAHASARSPTDQALVEARARDRSSCSAGTSTRTG